MYKIYRNSYCNISATAATDSEKGLFFPREPRELWEDDINLNVEGIPGKSQPWQQELPTNVFDLSKSLAEGSQNLNVTTKYGEAEKQRVERCRILDVSFWGRHVDDAPVNRRGWVLQERMMAPRVLHFCQGQVVWECRQLEASESARSGLPLFRVEAGDIVRGSRLKSLIPHEDLLLDPAPEIHYYQCWKRIVEVYSKTQLTNPEDKLIALSGIASMMYEHIKDEHIAGMWRKYLESQLLWYVDPWFENGLFYYVSERVQTYRAPSDNRFGLVEEPSQDVVNVLRLKGIVKQIQLMVQEDPKGVVRYHWKLVTRSGAKFPTHRNVYLDSPNSDADLLGLHAQMYCLPARRDSAGYLICILLQLERNSDMEETGRFKRVGLTRIPNYEEGQEMVLKPSMDDDHIPYGNWNAHEKKHTIEIV